jgi:hypothetical protein
VWEKQVFSPAVTGVQPRGAAGSTPASCKVSSQARQQQQPQQQQQRQQQQQY